MLFKLCEAAVWAQLTNCSDEEFSNGRNLLGELLGCLAENKTAVLRIPTYVLWGLLSCGAHSRRLFAALQAHGWSRQQAAANLLHLSLRGEQPAELERAQPAWRHGGSDTAAAVRTGPFDVAVRRRGVTSAAGIQGSRWRS